MSSVGWDLSSSVYRLAYLCLGGFVPGELVSERQGARVK